MFASRSSCGFLGILVLLSLLVLQARFGVAQPRRILDPPSVAPSRVPDESRNGLDWERFLGGVIQGSLQGGRRPSPGHVPEATGPSATPSWPPGYVRPLPGRLPVWPPGYFRPADPGYVPPTLGRWIPENVVTPPSVVPEPNQVRTSIPPQPSPLAGRVWEVSGREARCYLASLAELANQSLSACLNTLGKGAPESAEIAAQVQQIQQQLANAADWREIEPIARRLVEDHRSVLQEDSL
jgi:hypothetical protein